MSWLTDKPVYLWGNSFAARGFRPTNSIVVWAARRYGVYKSWVGQSRAMSVLPTQVMRTGWVLALMLLIVWMVGGLAHAAPSCRKIRDREVCIVELKRSAKNYWEYRAVVQVDGAVRSPELYNCRDRTRLQSEGRLVAFESDGIGDFVCRLFKR